MDRHIERGRGLVEDHEFGVEGVKEDEKGNREMHLHERHCSLRRHGRDLRPDRPYRGRCREDEDLRILPRLHQSAASLCLIAQTLATE